MKMLPANYQKMKDDIRTVLAARGIDIATADGGTTGLKAMYAALDVVSRNRSYNDEHPSFKAGMWKRIIPFDGRDYCFYYEGGCNDTHVATALKSIKAELIGEKSTVKA